MAKGIRKQRRSDIKAFEIERAAVRAAVSRERFQTIESHRALYPGGEEHDEYFWRLAREEVVRQAQKLPEPGAAIIPAKIGCVCASFGASVEKVEQLLDEFDLRLFVQAAETNCSIQTWRADPRYKNLWAATSIRINPPMRVEFDHAIVLANISEAGDIAKNKTWGGIIHIEPLRPDDVLHPLNITYLLKASSQQRMRWEFRDTFKNILGPNRRLVGEAMHVPKRTFIKELSRNDAHTIWVKLDLRPAEFWDAVRHGERFGPNGIESFVERLEQTTKGYRLDFGDKAHA